jgi:hypothetical protein
MSADRAVLNDAQDNELPPAKPNTLVACVAVISRTVRVCFDCWQSDCLFIVLLGG